MKKSVVNLVCILFCLCLFTSCGDDNDNIIWDINPNSIFVKIEDQDGNDLINPESPDRIAEEDIYLEYNDKTYTGFWFNDRENWDFMGSRYYLAIFSGFIQREEYSWNKEDKINVATGRWVLYIGEFFGDEDYDESMTLYIKGHPYEFRVTNRFWWKNNEPNKDTHYYLNGTECTRNVTIVVER
ncbi:MAG: hypothetical protein NC043_05705 [Muribaculaceae bacterium]|nr:hypothetical protein [Muribaculaceae bacterium]